MLDNFQREEKLIKSLEIINYKGFKDFKINKLNKINIFVGNNNSGKTSILEAVYIGMKNNFMGSMNIIQNRNLNNNSKAMETLFRNLDTNNKISITLKNSESSFLTEISPVIDNNIIIPMNFQNEAGIQSQEEKSFIINKDGKKVFYNFSMKTKANGTLEQIVNIKLDNSKDISTTSKDIINSDTYFISPKTRMSGNFANELKEQIKSKIQKKKILEELQLFDSKVEDIIVDGTNIEVYLKGVDNPFPIEALGAGIFTILEIASILGKEKIDNIFIDEIEDGLHIQSMEIVAKYLAKTIEKKSNLQLFITTHSVEIIKLITKYQADKNIVSAYRIYSKNDKTQVVEYSDDLLATLEEGWEIR